MGEVQLLVVEDDSLVSWALEKAALAHHASVRIAATASAALDSVREGRFDLAFVDIHLPDANGLDLLPRLRALSPTTKFVLLSCDATPANRECAYERGAWQFIEKPFEFAEIARLLALCAGPVEERREQPRHLQRIPVRVDLIGAGPGEEVSTFEATIHDTSGNGVRIASPVPLRAGQSVRLRVPGWDESVYEGVRARARARVVWVVANPDGCTAGLAYLPADRVTGDA